MSLSKSIRRHLQEPEEAKGFSDFVRERPLDVKLRRMLHTVLNRLRTRKARLQ